MKIKNILQILAIALILISGFSSYAQNVFTVTKTSDPDPFIYSTNPDDSEIVGTIQWAIRKVNDDTNPCVINFNIPVSGQQEISLNYELPMIRNNNVVIDATTQTGYSFGNPMVKINGQNNLGTCFQAYKCELVIKGVHISDFKYHGISGDYASNSIIQNCVISDVSNVESDTWSIGVRFTNSTNCTIQGNFIGTDGDNNNLGIENVGIFMWLNSNNSLIGGSTQQEANTIAYCGNRGIWITSSTGNKITQNRIFNNPEAIVTNGGGNNEKTPPVIISYNAVTNLLSGTSQPNDTIEIFGSTGSENANEYLISTTTNTSGDWNVTVPEHEWGYVVTTATDVSNNTSRVSNVSQIDQGVRYWISNSTANWNNPVNWSLNSGGLGGASVPDLNKIVIFDENGIGSCKVNSDIEIGALEVKNGYFDEIDLGGYSLINNGITSLENGILTNGSVEISGDNISFNNCTIKNDITVILNSINSQTVTNQSENKITIPQLRINNFYNIELLGDFIISNNLIFENGKIIIPNNSSIEFADNSVCIGANNSKFIDGKVIKKGDDAFTFPVGKGANYQPISISKPAEITDVFTAEYFNTQQPFGSNLDPSLVTISSCEYWELNRDAGNSSVSVTIGWNENSCDIANDIFRTHLLVWDGSNWIDIGNGGNEGNSTSGTVITECAADIFGPFTIASYNNMSLFENSIMEGEITYEKGITTCPPAQQSQAEIIDRFNKVYKIPGGEWKAPLPKGANDYSGSKQPATINCNGFLITFEDIEIGNGIGFDDGNASICNPEITLGQERVNTVCEVFSYIANVIDIGSVTPDIYIAHSEMDGTGPLGSGSPLFGPGLPVDFVGGYLQYHITTGTDLTPSPGEYDAMIRVDFGDFIFGGNVITLNPCMDCPNGAVDLYSLILHEATHTLGFFSLISPDGSSSLGGAYSLYDKFLQYPAGTNLVNSSAIFVGNSSDLISNEIIYSATGNTEDQPVFSPSSWIDGSSLSHLDQNRSSINFVMRNSTSGGDDRRWTLPEVEILQNLGYSLHSSIPSITTNNYPVGVEDFGTTTPGVEICIDVLSNDIDIDGNDISAYATCNSNCSNPGFELNIIGGGDAYISGNQICYTPPTNFSGTAIIQYCVTDGQTLDNLVNISNPVNVYIDVFCEFCADDPCNFVCNGSFEDGDNDTHCSNLGFQTFDPFGGGETAATSWRTYSENSSPDYFKRGDSNCGSGWCIPKNYFSCDAPSDEVDTHNGTPNDRYVGLLWSSNGNEGIISEPMTNALNPGTEYILEFYAYSTGHYENNGEVNAFLDINSSYPSGTPTVDAQTLNTQTLQNNTWVLVSYTFTPNHPYEYLIIKSSENLPIIEYNVYIYIDDVSIRETSPEIEITNTVDDNSPEHGQIINYTITVDNTGTNDALDIEIEDNLPVGLTYNGGSFNYPNHTIPVVAAGESVTLTIQALVENSVPYNLPLNNCATVISGGNNCTNLDNIENCSSIEIQGTDLVTQVSHLIYVPISLNYSRFFFP